MSLTLSVIPVAASPLGGARLARETRARQSSDPHEHVVLAALVREWIELSDRSRPRGDEPRNASEDLLFLFVTHRLRERADTAAEEHDQLNHRFAMWEVEWVERAWHDLALNPAGRHEVEQYLRRTACRYRRHPDFQVTWREGRVPSASRA